MAAGPSFPATGQVAQLLSRAGKSQFLRKIKDKYNISFNNLDLSFFNSIGPNSLVSRFFFSLMLQFTFSVCNLNNLTLCAEINQLSGKKNPSSWNSLILLWKKVFCSSSTQQMNTYLP